MVKEQALEQALFQNRKGGVSRAPTREEKRVLIGGILKVGGRKEPGDIVVGCTSGILAEANFY